jgi:hypothetical protein
MMTPLGNDIGAGATAELSLRVSVASLVRVLFNNPNNNELMLALERRATLRKTEQGEAVQVKSQPFGGAIRILDLTTLRDLLGEFNFDSERSRAEQDFRIFIRPSAWPPLRDFCLEHMGVDNDLVLENDPSRELVEEFDETLGLHLQFEQYACRPVATLLEEKATPTDNIHAKRGPTVRIYRLYEATVTDFSLAYTMLNSSNRLSNRMLCESAVADAKNGGRGKANAILTLPWLRLNVVYRDMPPAGRNAPIVFEHNKLDVTVAALMEEIAVPRYQRV